MANFIGWDLRSALATCSHREESICLFLNCKHKLYKDNLEYLALNKSELLMYSKDDLKSLSRKDLEKLLANVKKALAAAKARDHREAKKAAAKAAAEFGFSLDEISETVSSTPKKVKAKPKSQVSKSKPQFANPSDRTQTWTGKGRQPNWYRDQIAAGTKREEMRI